LLLPPSIERRHCWLALCPYVMHSPFIIFFFAQIMLASVVA